jgi:hypothetical protein
MFHSIIYKFIQIYENLVTLRKTVPSYTSFSVCKSNEVPNLYNILFIL